MPLPCPFDEDTWEEESQDYGACVRLPVRLFARPEALMAAASAAAHPYWTAEHVRDAIAHLVADQRTALLHPKHVARDFAMSAFIADIPYSAHEVLENHTRAIEAWRAAHTLPS